MYIKGDGMTLKGKQWLGAEYTCCNKTQCQPLLCQTVAFIVSLKVGILKARLATTEWRGVCTYAGHIMSVQGPCYCFWHLCKILENHIDRP